MGTQLGKLHRVVRELQDDGIPVLLDMFCGSGGSSYGYFNSGFFVIGVDRLLQRYYPFPYYYADAFKFLDWAGDIFDAYHASPPCQIHSKARYLVPLRYRKPERFIDLIPKCREYFSKLDARKPWIIENVENAPLKRSLLLCGTMFNLTTYRHRVFESNVTLEALDHPIHTMKSDDIGNKRRHLPLMRQYAGHFAGLYEAQDDLSVYWMRTEGVSQSVPPVYASYIGTQLHSQLRNYNEQGSSASVGQL